MNSEAARQTLIEGQLRPNGVFAPAVLAAFAAVPRERFVPPELVARAYADESLEIGAGRWLLEPRILGRLLAAADPGPRDAALEVACATGYGTALLADRVALAVGVDSKAELTELAEANLLRLEYSNALVVCADPTRGEPGHAPYDVILVSAAVPAVPAVLLEQLADGGRLVAVLRTRSEVVGRAVICKKTGGRVATRVLFDAAAPCLPEFEAEPQFTF